MKIIYYILIVFTIFTLQSCFDIVEQVTLNTDGSGNFNLVLNLSKSKTKLGSIMKMKTINGHDVPTQSEVKQKFTDIEKAMAKCDGISNVKSTIDFNNFIATLSCNFKNVNQLNNVIKNINTKKDNKFIEKSYDYSAVTNVFMRLNKISLKDYYNKMSNADKEIFATANYTAVYKFAGVVNSVSNKDAKVSPSKKATMLQLNVLDIITNKKSIENKINLSK